MDSGNSESFQSSSGGDEEYVDSRGGSEPISSFNSTATANLKPPPPPPPLPDHHPPPFFDFDPNPIPFLNLDTFTWSPNLNLTSLIPSSSTTNPPEQKPDQPSAAPRSSKKRSRASRRAPTTVLTTDTINFRAMVQEFTGIPAPPFAPLSRFDGLFPSSTASPLPPYLLRPFYQNGHQAPPSDHLGSINFESLLQPSMPAFASAKPQMQTIRSDDNYGAAGELGIPTPDCMQSSNHGEEQSAWAEGRNQLRPLMVANHGPMSSQGSESVPPARGEGTVESWICSSD